MHQFSPPRYAGYRMPAAQVQALSQPAAQRSSITDRRPEAAAQLRQQAMMGNGVVQRTVFRGPRTEKAYKKFPSLEGMDRDEFYEKHKSDTEYYWDRESQVFVERKSKGEKKKKSVFVLNHEAKSKKVSWEKNALSNQKRKRVDDIMDRAHKIRKMAKTTSGNKVFELNDKLNSIFDGELNTSKKNNTPFSYNFSLGDVNFSIYAKKPNNVKTKKNLRSITKVRMKNMGGKESYPSMVEVGKYPLLSTGDHAQYLMALETLRNFQFIPGIMMKNKMIEGNKITKEEAIDPEKYGTFELIGAAGEKSNSFDDQRLNKTSDLLDKMDDKDDLKKMILEDDEQNFQEECKNKCTIM